MFSWQQVQTGGSTVSRSAEYSPRHGAQIALRLTGMTKHPMVSKRNWDPCRNSPMAFTQRDPTVKCLLSVFAFWGQWLFLDVCCVCCVCCVLTFDTYRPKETEKESSGRCLATKTPSHGGPTECRAGLACPTATAPLPLVSTQGACNSTDKTVKLYIRGKKTTGSRTY